MTSTAQQLREALGTRLRELRLDSGLSGRELARQAGWGSPKVSKIEYGGQRPSEDDLRQWCQVCGCPEQLSDLIATVRNVESAYVEWRRILRAGTHRRQQAAIELEADTSLLRIYEPLVVPGLLQTPGYASAVMSAAIRFYGVRDDTAEGVRTRIARQKVLFRRGHKFHVLVGEQALLSPVGSDQVMTAQLDHLRAVTSMPGMRLGVIPVGAVLTAPALHGFWIYDTRLVLVETYAAELKITQPREIAVYSRAHELLGGSAVYGSQARTLIADARPGAQEKPGKPAITRGDPSSRCES